MSVLGCLVYTIKADYLGRGLPRRVYKPGMHAVNGNQDTTIHLVHRLGSSWKGSLWQASLDARSEVRRHAGGFDVEQRIEVRCLACSALYSGDVYGTDVYGLVESFLACEHLFDLLNGSDSDFDFVLGMQTP